MRRLMWFSVGFAAACAFTAYIVTSLWLLAAAAGILGLCLLAWVFLRVGKMRSLTVCVALGAAIGLLWCQIYDYSNLSSARQMDGSMRYATFVAQDYGQHSDDGTTVRCLWEYNDESFEVLAYGQKDMNVSPGDNLVGRFSFRYTGLGAEKEPTYHRGEGIVLLAYPDTDITVIPTKDTSSQYLSAQLRHELVETIETVFPEDTAAFAQALLLGRTETLSYKTDTDLKVSGIRHVVAVSGLHVSFLLAMIFFVTGRRGAVAFCSSAVVLVLFAAVVGFTPSVMRACIMQLLMLLGAWLKREYDPLTALSVAVLLILGINPQTVTSAGFQLSVGCVLGIILFAGPLLARMEKVSWIGTVKGDAWKHKFKRYVLSTVAVSVGATVFTIPLSALYFGTVSIASVLTNILCLWLISYLFVGVLLCCVLALLWSQAGTAAAWVVSWGIRAILWIVGVIASFPYASVYTQSSYIRMWIIAVYGIIGTYFAVPRLRKKLVLWMIPLLLVVAIFVSWLSPRVSNYCITVLDVGQGQCVLLQADGRTYMVDCGGSSDTATADVAAAQLLSQGITRLDGLILTHYDEDHAGGAPYLMERIQVDEVYLPYEKNQPLRTQIIEKSANSEYIRTNRTLRWDGASITMYPAETGKSNNENSMCILFQTKECAILITGDRDREGEEQLLQENSLPKLDVLIVGHHGSNESTSESLLRQLEVKTAVISVGEGNMYGHPAPAVLYRLERNGCTIYRTDQDGTVIIRG